MKRRNKIVQEITRNVANVFSFYAIIAIEHVFFQCINICQVPWEVLKTAAMFDPYNGTRFCFFTWCRKADQPIKNSLIGFFFYLNDVNFGLKKFDLMKKRNDLIKSVNRLKSSSYSFKNTSKHLNTTDFNLLKANLVLEKFSRINHLCHKFRFGQIPVYLSERLLILLTLVTGINSNW